jgi:hypothetical protein
MAQKLHRQLITETSELQQRVVIETLVAEQFAGDALPTTPLLHSYNNALTKGPETIKDTIKRHKERIAENVELIREIEARFAEHEEADVQAFAQWFAARWKGKL